jgi:hypothetical protein
MAHLSNYATTVAANDSGEMVVTYHNRQIVKFTKDYVVLNMGGFNTVTTRRKMNQAAEQFNLPYNVNGNCYITNLSTGENIPFSPDKVERISRYSV